MTECSQIASVPVGTVGHALRPGSVGKAAGPEILILNSTNEPAATGAEGEILVRGPGVAAGYEDDAASAASFWTGLGSRWFRTGDIGRMDADGFLYLSGRKREMIDRGGEKVWPREVEEVLERHPAVEQAVVFAFPHRTLGEEVGAAVVLRAGDYASEADLRGFAADQLASFQVPARIAFLPSIRLGAGEKPERAKMALHLGMGPAGPYEVSEALYSAPGTAIEKELAAIWREILRAPRIGLDDDFFGLGGDSLAVATLSAAVQERYGVMRRVLDRADFFAHPTIRTQALIVERAHRAKAQWQPPPPEDELPANLVPLNARPRRSEDAPPLFLAPMAGANPLYLSRFAHHLMAEQRCYGMDISAAADCESVATLALTFIASIDAVYPEGPFYLGGHCFGGVLAYELARQFAARGRQPAALYLFDVPTPGYPNPARDTSVVTRGLLHHATDIAHYGEFARVAWRHLKKLNAKRLESVGVPAADEPSVRLMRLYEPRPYQGDTVLFLARKHEQTDSPLDRRLGWRGLIQPSIEVVEVDSTHLDLFDEPHAVELAAVCRQRLPRRAMESLLALAESVKNTRAKTSTGVRVTP